MTPTSLIQGQLTEASFADFVQRLRYDTIGERSRDHCTADAIFLVQHEEKIFGIDTDYCDTDQMAVICDDWTWYSPREYWDHLDTEGKWGLRAKAREEFDCTFLQADILQQWDLLGRLDNHTVTGYMKQWITLNTHLTYAAAEAFIKRKAHDYGPLRIYADSAYWCWELKAIREALMKGTLVYQPKEQSDAPQSRHHPVPGTNQE